MDQSIQDQRREFHYDSKCKHSLQTKQNEEIDSIVIENEIVWRNNKKAALAFVEKELE